MKNIVLLCYILITIIFSHCKEKPTLKIAGSETMNVMMRYLASEYQKQVSEANVIVEGGGSESGIDRLRKDEIDIAVSSRDLTQVEFDELRQTGNLEKVRIAYDGVALVVNRSNQIQKLHLTQVSDVFSGKIKNWKELGGNDQPIQVVIRNDKSGTQDYFEKHILKQKDLGVGEFEKNKNRTFPSEAKIVLNNVEMANYIQSNPQSIGFMGMGSALVDNKDKIKALDYARQASDEFVSPSAKNVFERKYKLARELFAIYKTDQGGKIDAFISYLTGEKGQELILKSGYLRASLPEVEVTSETKQK
jgi:phosphate transport system substrate-binding protein